MKKVIIVFLAIFILIPSLSSAAFSDNTYYQYQWYISGIKYFEFLSNLKKGEGVTVAVIDSGVWLQHPDLAGAEWRNQDEIADNNIDDDLNGKVDDFYGWNFIDNNNDLTTKTDHGTAVAGIIAAQDNNQGMLGIAPRAKIMSLIVCGADGACSRTSVINAIKYAADNGAKVINLSLGGSGYMGYTHDYDAAISYAYSKGVFIVASAGNGDVESNQTTGQNLSFTKVSPTNNDVSGVNMVWGVGATNSSGSRTAWSNYGSGVDSYAPGETIAALTVPAHHSGYYYADVDGTSFSAPMVSAVVAMLFSNYPTISIKQIQDRLGSKSILDVQDIFTGQHESVYGQSSCFSHATYVNGLCICDQGYELSPDRMMCVVKSNIPVIEPVPAAPLPVPLICPQYSSTVNNKCICNKGYTLLGSKCVVQKKIQYVTVTRAINVREKNNTKSKVLGVLRKGVKYEIVDLSVKDWVKIKYNNKVAWVVKSLVKIIQ